MPSFPKGPLTPIGTARRRTVFMIPPLADGRGSAPGDHSAHEAELATLLGACKRCHPEWLDLIALAAWTGMRQGEVLGLQWADFDFAGHFVEVRRTVGYRGGKLLVGSPKSSKARRVDLPPRSRLRSSEGNRSWKPRPPSASRSTP